MLILYVISRYLADIGFFSETNMRLIKKLLIYLSTAHQFTQQASQPNKLSKKPID